MSDSDVDTERTTVRTYVPGYQRDEWDDHADELDMSRSEFVRSMVQAGRRGFLDAPESTDDATAKENGIEDSDEEEVTAGADLEARVLAVLSEESYLSWEELLEAVTDGIEERLESTMQELQTADEVRYSGRNGGYTLDE